MSVIINYTRCHHCTLSIDLFAGQADIAANGANHSIGQRHFKEVAAVLLPRRALDGLRDEVGRRRADSPL